MGTFTGKHCVNLYTGITYRKYKMVSNPPAGYTIYKYVYKGAF